MNVVHSRADFLARRAELSGDVGAVLTMGALHAGHVALMQAARAGNGTVVATVFVNPLQFGAGEDLTRYPRSLDKDIEVAEKAGVDLLWAPGVADVYPAGSPGVTVHPGPLGDELEGAIRPGHFAGVLTVVAKLLHLIRPARTYFGEKDYQQLVLVRTMATDLDLPVEICGVPTVREPDGLALSSRNVYLSADERLLARTLSRALRTGSLETAAAELAAQPEIAVDYLALRAADLGPVVAGQPARLLLAAQIGKTRLIDNVAVTG